MKRISVWVLLFTMVSSGMAWADTVYMKMDDRISGELIRVNEGSATIHTGFAGTLPITRDAIHSLWTSKIVTVLLLDARLRSARIVRTDIKKPWKEYPRLNRSLSSQWMTLNPLIPPNKKTPS